MVGVHCKYRCQIQGWSLAAENRILRAKVQGRLLLSDAEKTTLAEIACRLGGKALEGLTVAAKPPGKMS